MFVCILLCVQILVLCDEISVKVITFLGRVEVIVSWHIEEQCTLVFESGQLRECSH